MEQGAGSQSRWNGETTNRRGPRLDIRACTRSRVYGGIKEGAVALRSRSFVLLAAARKAGSQPKKSRYCAPPYRRLPVFGQSLPYRGRRSPPSEWTTPFLPAPLIPANTRHDVSWGTRGRKGVSFPRDCSLSRRKIRGERKMVARQWTPRLRKILNICMELDLKNLEISILNLYFRIMERMLGIYNI